MDYFLISQDKQFKHAPVIGDWFGRFDKRNIINGLDDRIPEQMLFDILPDKQTTFIDLLDFPYFLLSQRLKDLVSKYEPYLTFKEIILLDGKNQLSELYYLPILDVVDCLSPQSETNKDKSFIAKGVLDTDKIRGQSIFRLGGVNCAKLVARLDLVESILRRSMQGISLTKLETERR